MICGCYFCREVDNCGCEGVDHNRTNTRWARKYKNGAVWWGKNAPKGGVMIKICDGCVDAFSEEPVTLEELQSEVGGKP